MSKVEFEQAKRRERVCSRMLQLYKKANAGHIGSSLSCLEILLHVFFEKMNEQDHFVLSKGHAAGALYCVLAERGLLPTELLDTFGAENSLLPAHPPCSRLLKAIPFGTGSLGHGLSLATGLAFSTKFTKKKLHSYCVLSDGDCNEGSTWEAALFAAQHRLDNLTVVVDANGLQGLGPSKDVLNLEPLTEKWQAFGFAVAVAENGNSFKSLRQSAETLESTGREKPKCIIARTTKGHGVSFMENQMQWHYLPMSDSQFSQAIRETTELAVP